MDDSDKCYAYRLKKADGITPSAFLCYDVLFLLFKIILPSWSVVYSPSGISSDIGTILYPLACIASIISGRACGVFFAPLCRSIIDPGHRLFSILLTISCGDGSFQSRESLLATKVKIYFIHFIR